MEKLIDEILKNYVISHIDKLKGKGGYMVAIIKLSEYGSENSKQEHFTGDSLKEIFNDIVNFLNEN